MKSYPSAAPSARLLPRSLDGPERAAQERRHRPGFRFRHRLRPGRAGAAKDCENNQDTARKRIRTHAASWREQIHESRKPLIRQGLRRSARVKWLAPAINPAARACVICMTRAGASSPGRLNKDQMPADSELDLPRGGRRPLRVPGARRAASIHGVSRGVPVRRQPPRRRRHRAGSLHQGLSVARPVPAGLAVELVDVPDCHERVHRSSPPSRARRRRAVRGRGRTEVAEHARRPARPRGSTRTRASSGRCSSRKSAACRRASGIVFVMRHHQGMKLCEIAVALGLAEGTVKRQLHAAVHRLRQALSQANVIVGGRP